MTRRRSLLTVPAAAASTLAAAPAESSPAILELRYFYLRNSADTQAQRTSEFLRGAYMPALARAGGKLEGVFSSFIAPNSPFLVALSTFNGFAAFGSAIEKLQTDKVYQKELAALDARGGQSYVRMETSLLRTVPTMPQVEKPPTEGRKQPRLFELRSYESNNPITLHRKIAMFESGGELAIFRRVGMIPIFFGEAIAGARLPNLTYMLGYDNLEARDKLWSAFGSDPEWQKLRAQPGLSDAEIVSNISNVLLRPLAFSPVR